MSLYVNRLHLFKRLIIRALEKERTSGIVLKAVKTQAYEVLVRQPSKNGSG